MRNGIWLLTVVSLLSAGCPRSGESVDVGGVSDTNPEDGVAADAQGHADYLVDDTSAGDQTLPDDSAVLDGSDDDAVEPSDHVVPEEIADDMVEPADLPGTDLPESDVVEEPDGSEDAVCLPDCEDKECGPDGCGGTCGTCPEIAPVCDDDGLCQFDCPAPDCQVAGERSCVDETSYQTCIKPDAPCPASLYWSEAKDCLEGTMCVDGECLATDPCEQAAENGSHFGCSFWSVDLAVYADPFVDPTPDASPHALYLVAPAGETATISFATTADGIVLGTTETTLCGGCSSALTLPVMSLTGAGIFDRSVHVTSDRPIAVAQVNPDDVETAVSDASLLWPEHLLHTNYTVAAWPTQPLEQGPFPGGLASQHGYFAVVAVEPGATNVSFTLPVAGKPLTVNGQKLAAGQEHSVVLAQHEVLQVLADGSALNGSYDLTGATVAADHPVAVFGGHEEAVVCWEGAQDTCCADHIESQLLPMNRWGHHHVCVKAPPRSGQDQDVWRVVAGNVGAELATSPVIAGLNGISLGPGEWAEAVTKEDFELFSDQPVQVIQYLVGKECAGASTGDPAMVNTIPKSGFATNFYAPLLPGYINTQAVVIRPAGKPASFAGTAITQPFEPIGQGTFERAYVPIPDGEWFEIPDGGMVYLYGFATVAGYGLPLGAEF